MDFRFLGWLISTSTPKFELLCVMCLISALLVVFFFSPVAHLCSFTGFTSTPSHTFFAPTVGLVLVHLGRNFPQCCRRCSFMLHLAAVVPGVDPLDTNACFACAVGTSKLHTASSACRLLRVSVAFTLAVLEWNVDTLRRVRHLL